MTMQSQKISPLYVQRENKSDNAADFARVQKNHLSREKLFTKRKFDHFSADDSRPTMEKDKDKQKL